MQLEKVDYPAFTALVTGGTSGIGRAIANELAFRGIGRLAIVARNQDKLEDVSAEIKQMAPKTEV